MTSDSEAPPSVLRGRLKLMSFNIQVGLSTSRFSDYVTQGWRHVLPSTGQRDNLDRIAELVAEYDLVGIQETDAGSLRSANLNQVRYMAGRAEFPHWHTQVNRDLGQLAQHSLGLLARPRPVAITEHQLPGLIPGRGVLMARFRTDEDDLVLLVTHLSLSRRARESQLRRIADLVRAETHVIVMGDTNCEADDLMAGHALGKTGLRLLTEAHKSWPSWRPRRNIDHVLVSETLRVHSVRVVDAPISDHLPIAVEIEVP